MPIFATRPLQTLTMPTGSARSKRKDREDTYSAEDGGVTREKEKENNAPVTKKRRDEQKAPKTKKQKKSTTTTDMSADFGFDFRVRNTTRSTRSSAQTQTTKAAPSSLEPVAQSSLPPPPPDPSKSRVKKSKSQPAPLPPVEELRPKGKKKALNLGDGFSAQNAAAATAATAVTTPRIPRSRQTGIPVAGAGKGAVDALKVQLPVSDTPIIRKNQEFRKVQGNRRSSVGMRGRRASSLMDSGKIAEPHAEIAHEDFYKHIEGSLLEPRRMKHLIAWSGRRALSLPQRQSNDVEGNAHAVARIIQEELLKDVISRAELSSWFNRDDSPATTVIKLPNPRNAENLAKVQECEENLKRLREERETWRSMLQSDTQSSTSLSGGNPESKILDDKSLLTPAESEFASTLEGPRDMIGTTRSMVKRKSGEVEFQVEQVTNGVQVLRTFGEEADRLGAHILEAAESTLSAREARLRQSSGTERLPIQEILRSLSRMDR
ncbi:hypothetical protein RUND412_001326 [Rhizina undulata]